MKILLINPSCLADAGRDLYSGELLAPLFTLQPFRRMGMGLPLALPTLAAVTPAHHEIQIVDEEIEKIDFDTKADLVGLTAMTFKATRAYQIAAEFRKRGVTVVMGGVHASMLPEEAAQHVDTVVVGEAEETWPQLLADFEAGQLKAVYRACGFLPLESSPVPRYDLVNCRSYLYIYLQSTRGCPYNCVFCTVTKMNGRQLRRKTPDQVVAEIDMVLAQKPTRPFKMYDRAWSQVRTFVGAIAMIDDNFAINREHALAVCAAIRKYQQERGVLFFWYTQVNLATGFDKELLKAMADCGCRLLFIGFESLDQDVLASMNKEMNDPSRYVEALRNIEVEKMTVIYSTVFGDDHTTRESATQLAEFLEQNHVVHVLLNILTPFPGTTLHATMAQEGRLLIDDPQHYNIRNVVYRPQGMPTVDLESIYINLCRRLYHFAASYRRGRRAVAAGDRFYLLPMERFVAWLVMMFSGMYFALTRRMKPRSAWYLIRFSTEAILLDGSFKAMENLVASADYDDFLASEMARLGRRDGGRRAGLAASLIGPVARDLPLPSSNFERPRSYRAYYVEESELQRHGVNVARGTARRPVLVLAGTSISNYERKDFLGHLLWRGYEVAGIENPLGNLFDVHIDPVKERPEALRDYLVRLRDEYHVTGVDIVAQSYSAYEVVRVLLAEPAWASFVKSVVLLNPPGFDPSNNPVKHSLRFLFRHVLAGYCINLTSLAWYKVIPSRFASRKKLEHCRRETSAIQIWAGKTFSNLVRTLRELNDISSYRIKEPLQRVIATGVPVYLFLQSEDRLVPIQPTLKAVHDLVPDTRIKVVPGNHTDLFFQPWQRDAFCELLDNIRQQHF